MRMSAVQCLAFAGLAVVGACGGERAAEKQSAADSAAAPRVEIVRPADGDITGPNVLIQLAAHGVRVAPAQGVPIEGEGHHHLFVDKDVTPPGDTIPRNVDGIIHLGTGAEEFELKNLSPGSHRIIAVLAYGNHAPMKGVAADTVQIYVQAP